MLGQHRRRYFSIESALVQRLVFDGLPDMTENNQKKYKMTNGEMNARWITTCAIAGPAANWPRGQSRPWKDHIVIVLDRF